MPLISKPYTFSTGATIVAAEHNSNFDTLYNAINGNLDDTNLSSTISITNDKLAQIVTAGKVSGASLTLLTSIPSGAGNIPVDNLGNSCLLTTDQTVAGVKTFSSFPVTPSSAPTTDYQTSNKKYVDDTAQSFGNPASRNAGTIYHEGVAGFVYGWAEKASGDLAGFTAVSDSNASPSTVVQYGYASATGSSNKSGMTIMFFVEPTNYWQVTAINSSTISLRFVSFS